MKIVYIVNHLAPYVMHGTEVVTDKYARYLSERGHDIHTIIIQEKGIPSYERRNERYSVHAIPFTKTFTYTFGECIYFFRLLLLIKSISPDIVHAQMLQNGRFAVLLKWLLGVKAATSSRGSDIYTVSDLYKRTIGTFVVKNSDVVIALTDHMKEALQGVHNREIEIVPNGIDSVPLGNDGKREDIVVSVGRLSRIKGHRYLIRAMKTVSREFSYVRLFIIGDGEERDSLQQEISRLGLDDVVHLQGSLPNLEVMEWMGRAKVFVLPSLHEGFPNALLESMSVGTPVITTMVAGIPSIVSEGIEGFLVPHSNEQALSEKIIELLGDDGLRKRMGENAKSRAGLYLWENVISNLEGIYRHMIRGGSEIGNYHYHK